jgi:hypothetical protein
MAGVGHFPHAEEPVGFSKILVDFLNSTEPSEFAPEELRGLLREGTVAEPISVPGADRGRTT